MHKPAKEEKLYLGEHKIVDRMVGSIASNDSALNFFLHENCVLCFILGNSPASEFSMPTFRNTLSVPSSKAARYFFIPTRLWRWNRQIVPKRWHIKFRRRGIAKKKAYNVQNTTKVWNQESCVCSCCFRTFSKDLLPSLHRDFVQQSADRITRYIPLNFSYLPFSWNFQMAYSKATAMKNIFVSDYFK